jgi:Domain of unknown function (DUF5919)
VAVQLWNGGWVTALFAAVLGSFALSLVRLRNAFARPAGAATVFLDGTPPTLPAEFAKARDVVLVGVSLDRTIRNSVAYLEELLRSGGRLRVLVVNPDCYAAVHIADRRAYLEHGVEQRRQHILFTFDSLKKMGEATGKEIEVRVTDDPLTFGASLVDGPSETRHTQVVIQHYSYKKTTAREPNPVFVLRPADRPWFSEFQGEIDALWNDAAPYDLAAHSGTPATTGDGVG